MHTTSQIMGTEREILANLRAFRRGSISLHAHHLSQFFSDNLLTVGVYRMIQNTNNSLPLTTSLWCRKRADFEGDSPVAWEFGCLSPTHPSNLVYMCYNLPLMRTIETSVLGLVNVIQIKVSLLDNDSTL